MKKLFVSLAFIFPFFLLYSQNDSLQYVVNLQQQIETTIWKQYLQTKPYFTRAYHQYPTIPIGILEAISYSYTRFTHLIPDKNSDNSSQMPSTYGLMGLTVDGKGVFRENIRYVSQLSKIAIKDIIQNPQDNVLAFAAAYSKLQHDWHIFSNNIREHFPILIALSELPIQEDQLWNFPIQSQLYEYCQFIEKYRDSIHSNFLPIDFEQCFGEHLSTLQTPILQISASDSPNRQGLLRQEHNEETDYYNARWNAAGSCNYSVGRNNHAISAITIHYTSGTYAGAIAWFQNCTYNGTGAQVSAHYVVRSSDGQITQMVREADKAWHVGSANSYTIGIEHEAYGDISTFFTPIMYQASARLTQNICTRNSISPHRMFYRDTLDDGTTLNQGLHNLGGENACTKIRGHQHYPNQTHTDPGPYWNWNYYYKLVNPSPVATTLSNSFGSFTDSGGEYNDYENDERKLYLISVDTDQRITLSFTQFELEPDYDFLWIYDGSSVFSPLIGRWNRTSPNIIHSSGNHLLVEFRSDCATTAAGWLAQWYAESLDSTSIQDSTHTPIQSDFPPTTCINHDDTQWITQDYDLSFYDYDDQNIQYRFYQIMGNNGQHWTANHLCGFLCDNFDDLNSQLWTSYAGQWQIQEHKLYQSDNDYAVITHPLNGNLSSCYLFDCFVTCHATLANNNYAEIIFCADEFSATGQLRNGYSIQILPTDRKIQLLRYFQGFPLVISTIENINTNLNISYFYRIVFDKANSTIMIYRSGQLLHIWHDTTPYQYTNNFFGITTQKQQTSFDNLRVYRSRGEQIRLHVGNTDRCDGQYQARHNIPCAKIKSIVVDNAGQFSSLTEKSLLIDYTPPQLKGRVRDGYAEDIDEMMGWIAANWDTAHDENGDIEAYYYDILPISNNISTMKAKMTLIPSFSIKKNNYTDQWYIIRVQARNKAGLFSNYIYSNGFHYIPDNTVSPQIPNVKIRMITYPNPSSDYLKIALLNDMNGELENNYTILIYNMLGQEITRKTYDHNHSLTIHVADWPQGIYFCQLQLNNQIISTEKIIKK